MSSSQGPKRKNGADELTGREKKKQRMNVARTISVQPSSVVRPGSGVVNGTCTSLHPGVYKLMFKQGMVGLPSAIDVEKFAEVCEIRPLDSHNLHTDRRERSRSMPWRRP